jgi:hypothetical protein
LQHKLLITDLYLSPDSIDQYNRNSIAKSTTQNNNGSLVTVFGSFIPKLPNNACLK